MKWMIASDLHGSAFYCKKMIKAFERERADRLLLLGDLLYHGPRNDLPEGYAPKEVIPLLNGLKAARLRYPRSCAQPEKSAAAGSGRYPAAWPHPYSGVDRVRRRQSLPEPRFCEHPKGGECT